MTSVVQFFDINDDPFIVQGRKLIESMTIQVGTTCCKGENSSDFFESRSIYLYFPSDGFTMAYSDFLIKAFANKIDCHPPIKIVRKDGEYISTFFKDSLRLVTDKPIPHFWGKEDSLKVKKELQEYLNEYLVQYFYDYFCF